MKITSLAEEANRICNPFDIPKENKDRVIDVYRESWRTYHGTEHIKNMLSVSRKLPTELTERQQEILELMILYHDVWYKVGRELGENESNSAQWAMEDLSYYRGDDRYDVRTVVAAGIYATLDHTLGSVRDVDIPIVSTLLDLDLWGLGQDHESFEADTEKIWQEYMPVCTREEFKAGRSKWAKEFLASRSQIYFTKPFARFEAQAKKNLARLADR